MMVPSIKLDGFRLILTLPDGRKRCIGQIKDGVLYIRRMKFSEHFHRNKNAYGFCMMAINNYVKLAFTLVDFKAATPDGTIHSQMLPSDMLAAFREAGYQYEGYERQGYLTIATIKRLDIANRVPPPAKQESLFA